MLWITKLKHPLQHFLQTKNIPFKISNRCNTASIAVSWLLIHYPLVSAMAFISIAIGRCGLGVHSAVTQYASDYIGTLYHTPELCVKDKNHNSKGFADALRRLYFKDKPDGEGGQLSPRSIVIGSDVHGLECFDSTKVGNRIRKRLLSGIATQNKGTPYHPAEWSYDADYILHLPEASYDIWSHGFYTALSHEELLSEYLRKTAEDADSLSGFLSIGSLAGGTGSGMGSYVAQFLSDRYQKTKHITIAVAPFTYGESGTQALNVTLALATYQEFCDGIMLMQNDCNQSLCEKLFGTNNKSLDAINEMYAMNLFHSLRPPVSTCPISESVRFHKPLDYITDGLCSYPSLKLLNLDLLPCKMFEESNTNSLSLQQMGSQLADSLKADPTLGDRLTNEKISVLAKEWSSMAVPATSKSRSATGPVDQVLIQDFSGYQTTKINQNQTTLKFTNARYTPVTSPVLPNVRVVENGICRRHSSGSDEKATSTEAFKLIKTVGKKRSTITKYNVVAALQLNLGGIIREDMNLAELYQDVLFWQHSTRPIQLSYCPSDTGLFGCSLSQISNSQAPMALVDFNSTTAKMAYATNTNMHHYTDAGLQKDDIQNGLITIQDIMSSYAALSTN